LTVFCSGATGYIGSAILRCLAANDIEVFGGTRRAALLPAGVKPCVTGDLAQPGFLLPAVDTVIHAAGLGHRRRVSRDIWRRANVDAAVNLARAARAAGAKKFILLSTAHVHGRVNDRMVTDTTPPNPMDFYAESKLQAEHDVAGAFGPGLTIIRPVAVIGPNCPGNIPLLLKALRRGIPLPFGALDNRRSFIERDDLAKILLLAVLSPQAPESILAAHPEAISTPELIRALAEGLDVRPRIPNWPPQILGLSANLLGRAAMWQSLSGNFTANPAAARALGWNPAQTLAESFRHTSRYYDTTHQNA
jgi:UDP-glucose 4-epimerase